MIEKVHEDRFGTIIYTGLTKDLEIINQSNIKSINLIKQMVLNFIILKIYLIA